MTMTSIPEPTTQIKEGIAQVTTWTELVKFIDATDGIALVPMETLRRLEGAQRLGVHVLNSISARLSKLGVGFLPETLPNRQDQDAILFRYGTPASELVSAVHSGVNSQSDVHNTYRLLHKLNTLPEPADVVHKVELEEKLTTATQALASLFSTNGRNDGLNDMLGSLK